jgi:CBS-domain-containing membrane protein
MWRATSSVRCRRAAPLPPLLLLLVLLLAVDSAADGETRRDAPHRASGSKVNAHVTSRVPTSASVGLAGACLCM